MINRQIIERLAGMRTSDGVMSVSIKLDPRLAFNRDQAVAKFKGAYTRAARSAEATELRVLQREYDRVLDYLDGLETEGRGLVIYSSEPAEIWEVFPLQVMVHSYVTVGSTPDTTVLSSVVDEYPRMAIVLLDGGDARIYVAEQGTGEEKANEKSDLPGRHDQGGWSQARFERHIELHHERHLKAVCDALETMYQDRPFDRVVVVGVEQATKEFESYLPEAIQSRVIGRLTADFKQETDDEILERARELREEDERTAEVALVDRIRSLAEADGKGALGVERTAQAIVEGRVDTLAIASGMTQSGTLCNNCEYFMASDFKECPVCGSDDVEELPDVIEYAAEAALTKGARVNFVFNEASEMLVSLGGMGAILRYTVSAD